MPIKVVFLKLGYLWNISRFGIICKVRFDKVSLNAASYQTAGSLSSVRISKESKLKDLKSTKNAQEEHKK